MQPPQHTPLQHSSSAHARIPNVLLLAICFVFFLILIATFRSVIGQARAAVPELKSGITGYCLDDHSNRSVTGAVVDSWQCNNTPAQAWTVGQTTITHANNLCLAVQNNGKVPGDKVALSSCSEAPGQVWLQDNTSFKNPNSGLCLSMPAGQANQQLVIASCDAQPDQAWTPDASARIGLSCNGSEGQKVACYAIKEWTTWQSGGPSHSTLLTSYTDGAPYEEWCADFVSYVYKEAGYPFTGGETNGWDENNANNIQNMGFAKHDPANYTPQPGDVAYFNYNGGHVEIVVSGGKTPTFVYGNSATIDPTTGNGEMEANTITNDGSHGQLVYYLSPN